VNVAKDIPDYMRIVSKVAFIRDFQNRLTDPVWVKGMFYKEILPNSIQSEDATQYL
jgi:hypothetical protein